MNFRVFGLAVLIASSPLAAAAGDPPSPDAVPFTVSNSYPSTIGIWIRSEKSTRPDPWAHVMIESGKEAKIDLGSPDPFIIVVDRGEERSRSKPVALKAFLKQHPKYVMRVRVEALEGVPSAGIGLKPQFTASIDPQPEKDQPDPKRGLDDFLHLDFRAEP